MIAAIDVIFQGASGVSEVPTCVPEDPGALLIIQGVH